MDHKLQHQTKIKLDKNKDNFDDEHVGNLGLLRFHVLDHVGCMQIYPRLSKSIVTDKQLFKNNKYIIENIDLENKITYF